MTTEAWVDWIEGFEAGREFEVLEQAERRMSGDDTGWTGDVVRKVRRYSAPQKCGTVTITDGTRTHTYPNQWVPVGQNVTLGVTA